MLAESSALAWANAMCSLTMRELPPTAGLPLHWRDLLPQGGHADLEARLRPILGIDDLQVVCSGTAALVIALTTLSRNSRKSSFLFYYHM